MRDEKDDLKFQLNIGGTPEDVFYAFACAQGWRDWLCDSCRFEARPGGSYQMAWSNGWYAAGTVRELKHPERTSLTWVGLADPGPSEVTISLLGQDGDTSIELHHWGFGEGEEWLRTREEVRKGWEVGLENLFSIFDSGQDLRITRRPMLGVMLSDFDGKIAKELGVPVSEGVRIERPIEGMGADSAGLEPDDVIVEMDGKSIAGFPDLGFALQGKHAGEVVPVTFYRRDLLLTVHMELSSRPIEDFPLEPQAFAVRLETIYSETMAELRQLLSGIEEKQATFRVSPEDWTVEEVLAHLIVIEEGNIPWICELMSDAEREFLTDGGNPSVHSKQMQAVLHVTPGVPGLLDRLQSRQAETIALLHSADELGRRKGVLWRLGQNLLQFPGSHERIHLEQLRSILEAEGSRSSPLHS
jgi:uncharacterized protein YndB with AHSA1/START domain